MVELVGRAVTPDFHQPSIQMRVDALVHTIHTTYEQTQKPCILLGHSLGSVITGLAALQVPDHQISHIILLAVPFGKKKSRTSNRFVYWLIKHRLLPGFLIRNQFFGPSTPDRLKKEVFSHAVKEPAHLIEEVAQNTWSHTAQVSDKLSTPTLCITSKIDHIVPWEQTMEYAQAIGADFLCFEESTGIGHDDYPVLPKAQSLLIQEIKKFIEYEER